MPVKTESTIIRILTRIPLRLSMKLITPLGYLGFAPERMKMLRFILKRAGVRMNGKPKFIAPDVYFDNFDKVTLGDCVVLSTRVCLLTHDYSLTTLMNACAQTPPTDIALIRPIVIGNNVFVGLGSIIMPGTVIGDNVIVGAGSVVRGEVQAGSVVMGNPAQVVMTMDDLHKKYQSKLNDGDILRDTRKS